MGFWFAMLAASLLTPAIMLLFGWMFKNNPPQNINGVYGYRTGMSMKNRDTWDFAHRYCGTLWVKLGFVLLPASLAAMLTVYGGTEDEIGSLVAAVCLLQVVALLFAVVKTERALKQVFDKNGVRR
ncbi:MAG: SdpI family protein [Firmicutes bacterium]|nr:SdpI family protein [Bacillota bacterium]